MPINLKQMLFSEWVSSPKDLESNSLIFENLLQNFISIYEVNEGCLDPQFFSSYQLGVEVERPERSPTFSFVFAVIYTINALNEKLTVLYDF